jgi:hypothetical protein
VLNYIVKIGGTRRCVPFNIGPWSPVRDHFGDQIVRSTFATAAPFECYPGLQTWDDGSWTQKRFLLWLE